MPERDGHLVDSSTWTAETARALAEANGVEPDREDLINSSFMAKHRPGIE